MGIPRFYRWLSERYPRINQRIEENIELLPSFDNMYLDANGIIHSCSHPNDEETTTAHLTMEEMVVAMMGYIDRMVHIIRPKKVLFVAVDGCAPRAKMNQQRSRRFASARDSELAKEKAIQEGLLSPEEARDMFDSNVITPGTPFMAELSVHFEFFLRKKIKEDPIWEGLEIIYSGHDVPGEGEHKIMEYIRRTRTESTYDPNTSHCLCGLDADLMMLGLATHDPHFSLLREEVDFNSFRSRTKKNATKEVKKQISKDKWELLRISTLREYMSLEYETVKKQFPSLNFERVVDDWILMVMFVGNDFLPPIPSMDIFEGALDNIIEIHKRMLPIWKGHLTTDDGRLNWSRVESLFAQLGALEEAVFKKREEEKQEQERRNRKNNPVPEEELEDDFLNDEDEAELDEGDDLFSAQHKIDARRRRAKYYEEKFGIKTGTPDGEGLVREIVKRYTEGLDWVNSYYFQGVPSWIWFFPFHFSPLASDMKDLEDIQISHTLGAPFLPFNQLLGCLPSSSASKCLPPIYQKLMNDPTSPLKEFYPKTWEVDSNGKKNPWEFVNLLPFIDERKLFEAVSALCPPTELTAEELARNQFGHAFVYKKDLTNTMTLTSTVKSLPSVRFCSTSKKVFVYSTHAVNTRHNPNLLHGYHLLPGDSTLSIHPNLSLSMSGLHFARLNIFGSPSRKLTFILRFEKSNVLPDASYAKQLISNLQSDTVWINYPHLHEAKISKVMDVFGNFYDAEQNEWRECNGKEKKEFDQEAIEASQRALSGANAVGTGGIEVDRIYVMFKVKPFNGMKEDAETGSLKKSFSTEDNSWVPLQLILFSNPLVDERFSETASIPVQKRFENGTEVLCVGEKGYGLLGSVEGTENDQVLVRFPSKIQKQTEFGHMIASNLPDIFYPLSKISQDLGINFQVLDKILGSLKVWDVVPAGAPTERRGRPEPVDIGLNLRVGKTHVIPGYARSKAPEALNAAWTSRDAVVRVVGALSEKTVDSPKNVASDMFEYTQRSIDLVRRYVEKFPNLINRLSQRPNEHEYRKRDLFSKDEEVEKLLTWLRQIPTYNVPLIPVTSKLMSREGVLAVQNAAEELNKREISNATTVISIPPQNLVKPPSLKKGWIDSPTAGVPPQLGDRVCNLGSPSIPFGLRGTIIAIHPSTASFQIVFDTSFVGGTSQSGLCKPGYGALLPAAHVLNLSRKAPPVVKKEDKIKTKIVTSQNVGGSTFADLSFLKDKLKMDNSGIKTTQSPSITEKEVSSTKNEEDVDDLAEYFKNLMAQKLASKKQTGTKPATTLPAQQQQPAKSKTTTTQKPTTIAATPAKPRQVSQQKQQAPATVPVTRIEKKQQQQQEVVAVKKIQHPQQQEVITREASPPPPIPIVLPHNLAHASPAAVVESTPVSSGSSTNLLDNLFARAHRTENRTFQQQ